MYFDSPYYLGPEKGGDKAYLLLAEAMQETGRAALARYAARGKQYLVISAWFNRGRALIMQVSLFAAFAGYTMAWDLGPKSFALRAVSTAFAVIVPFNVLLASWFPDGGVRQHRNYRWLLLGARGQPRAARF